jgi:hypothetical protein
MGAVRASATAALLLMVVPAMAGGETPRCSAWELVNPSAQANHMRDVAYGSGRWVAVGDGVAIRSLDSQTWTAVLLPGVSLHSVAYGNGVFVAVGDGGAVLRSIDGATWEEVEAGVSVDLAAVAFAGGRFLAVGEAASVLSSADGVVWTQEWPAEIQGDLTGVRVSGSFAGDAGPMFLVWGPSSIALRRLDGTWRAIPLPAGAVVSEAVFWVNSAICATFSCVGGCAVPWGSCGIPTEFYVTHDGTSWEWLCYGLDHGPTDVVANGKSLVALHRYPTQASSTLWTTPDGWSWFQQSSAFNVPMRAIEAGGGRFVAVGDYGAIWTSTNGTTWTSASGPTIDLDRVAWNGAAFAASGSRTQAFAGWQSTATEIVGGEGGSWSAPAPYGIELAAGGNRIFIALGTGRIYPHAQAFQSADGVYWSESGWIPSWPLLGGMFDGRRFVVLAGGWWPGCRVTCNPVEVFAAVGEDSADWAVAEQPDLLGQHALSGMATNGEKYVALGMKEFQLPDGGCILTSDDGLIWQAAGAVVGAAAGKQAVASDGHGFVGVRGEVVVTSADGLAWSSASVAPLDLIGVMWTGDEYVAVGDDGAGHAAIARSKDGVAWASESFPAIPARLLAVAGGQRVQLAVGEAGLTLRRDCHPQAPSRRLPGVR